mgnify:CR=1 FL=1
MPKVALIMGSKSDWPSLRGCVDVLKGFEIEVEVHVASAHRTPETVAAFAANARENGFEAIIAAAGKAVTPGGAVEICRILGREETLRRLRIALEKLG